MSIEEALAELRANSGTQFNPRVVDALARIVELTLPAPETGAAAGPGAPAPLAG
jgi:HD-GYP domain-containing protein (c-di-GMP phosphodiesterase class II)